MAKSIKLAGKMTMPRNQGLGALFVIRISNLPYRSTYDELNCLLRLNNISGKISLSEGTTSNGQTHADVHFTLEEKAAKAIAALNGYFYRDSILNVRWYEDGPKKNSNNYVKDAARGSFAGKIEKKMPRKRLEEPRELEEIPMTIVISNLPEHTRLDDFFKLLGPFGYRTRTHLAQDRSTSLCRGFAHVTFRRESDAWDAIDYLDGRCYQNSVLSALPVAENSQNKEEQPVAAQSESSVQASNSTDRGFKIKISNLPETTTRNDLIQLAKPFGTVKWRYLYEDRETSLCKGHAYVDYKFEADAAKAISGLNGSLYRGVTLSARWNHVQNEQKKSLANATGDADKKESTDHEEEREIPQATVDEEADCCGAYGVVISELPESTTLEEFYRLVKAFGHLRNAYLVVDRQRNVCLGSALAYYKYKADAQRAIDTLNDLKIKDATLNVEWSVAPELPEKSAARETIEETGGAEYGRFEIKISNLPRDITLDGFNRLVNAFGQVVKKRLIGDEGFAEYKNEADADKARVTLNNKYYEGFTLSAKWAISEDNDVPVVETLKNYAENDLKPEEIPTTSTATGNETVELNKNKPCNRKREARFGMKIFNLPLKTTRSELFNLTKPFGELKSMFLNEKPSANIEHNVPKAYYKNKVDADRAIRTLNGSEFKGTILKVVPVKSA